MSVTAAESLDEYVFLKMKTADKQKTLIYFVSLGIGMSRFKLTSKCSEKNSTNLCSTISMGYL